MTPVDPLYRLEAVRHEYAGRVVLDLESLAIRRGETLALVGPSGSGKSTLLRLLQFLERPTAGRVWFDGQPADVEPPLSVRRRVTTVFQRPIVLDRSVRGNLLYGLQVRQAAASRAEIDGLLAALELEPLVHAHARTLSGGEVQRVALARALAVRPDVLLLDEPTANLDPRNVRLVEDLVRARQADGTTIVLATHQIFQARRLAHRAALLLDGHIVEIAPTADLFEHPADERTRAFLRGEMVY